MGNHEIELSYFHFSHHKKHADAHLQRVNRRGLKRADPGDFGGEGEGDEGFAGESEHFGHRGRDSS